MHSESNKAFFDARGIPPGRGSVSIYLSCENLNNYIRFASCDVGLPLSQFVHFFRTFFYYFFIHLLGSPSLAIHISDPRHRKIAPFKSQTSGVFYATSDYIDNFLAPTIQLITYKIQEQKCNIIEECLHNVETALSALYC